MKLDTPETTDNNRLENLPPLTLSEAAWMAGITADALERFLASTTLGAVRSLSVLDLVRACFTLLGQREAQLAIFRLQLTASLQREKELTNALHSKLHEDLQLATPPAPTAEVVPPPTTPAPTPPATPAPFIPQAGLVDFYVNRQKSKKSGKKR
ncbi:MAG: hypothetical protein HQM06_09970 [Magnetococcales bacterium]|nr:hypothetical protein [Magnetococcales bacterium]